MALSGYAVGLVQLFGAVPNPALMARHLLDLEMDDWWECARSYMAHLVLRREDARVNWETEVVEQLDVEIHEHAIHEQIPKRWGLDCIFSEEWHREHGDGIFAFWAEALVHLCTIEGYWIELLGDKQPTDPRRLPGFHSDEELCSTAWLDEFRQIWRAEIRMTTPSLVNGSTDAGVSFEPSGDSQVICVDLQSIASLIDAMAGYDPERLPVLLSVIWESSFKAEACTVLRAAVACRDPLSHLCAICTDALQTLADLEKLTRAHVWQSIVGHEDQRACALLNACDYEIARLQGRGQARYRAIRTRLETAAEHERLQRSEELRAIVGLRQEHCPGIWEMYEFWLERE